MDNNRVIVTSICAVLCLYLSIRLLKNEEVRAVENVIETETEKSELLVKRTKKVVVQPKCELNYNLQVQKLVEDYVWESNYCIPEDVNNTRKHKVPKRRRRLLNNFYSSGGDNLKISEPRATLVIYIAVGLLLMSLGAAVVDFFKAKSELMRESANEKKRAADKKKELLRQYSLADMTMKTQSGKTFSRANSIITTGSASSYEGDNKLGTNVSRPSLRLHCKESTSPD